MIETSDLNKEQSVKKSKKLAAALNNAVEFQHESQYATMLEYLKSWLIQTDVTRDSFYLELAKYRNNWIVEGIYDILTNDIFVDNSNNDFLKVTINDKDKKYEEEVVNLMTRLNMTGILQSIIKDLLHYGSYPLKIVTDDKKGVVALIDDVDPQNVISVNDSSNRPLCYFINEATTNLNNSSVPIYQNNDNVYTYYDVTQVLYFSLDLDFVKLSLPSEIQKILRQGLQDNSKSVSLTAGLYDRLDRMIGQSKFNHNSEEEEEVLDYDKSHDLINKELLLQHKTILPNVVKIRTSRSFVSGVMDKLKDTIILDKLSVYKNLADLFSPKLVGIPVPSVYDPAQLVEITQKYDTLLNSDLAKVTTITDLTALNLAEIAKVKVVPIAGDRSTPTPIDYGTQGNLIDPERVRESIGDLLNALGISSELFFGSTDAKTNIKINVRYAKKIKKIQRNICRVIKSLILIHFSIKYPSKEFFADDIDVQLKNNVNIDELENIESQDLVISATNSIFSLLDAINDVQSRTENDNNPEKYVIDYSEVIKATKNMLEMVGSPFMNCLKLRKETKDSNVVKPDYPEQTGVMDGAGRKRVDDVGGERSLNDTNPPAPMTSEEPKPEEPSRTDSENSRKVTVKVNKSNDQSGNQDSVRASRTIHIRHK